MANISFTSSFCPGVKIAANQWCTFTSTNIAIRSQKSGKGGAAEGDKDLHITCSYLTCVDLGIVDNR